jgi:hypothetical protein
VHPDARLTSTAGDDTPPSAGATGERGGVVAKRPALVTGMHRSGTTWLGHMLCEGGDFVRLGEPFSPVNRQTILPSRVKHWYTYVNSANEDDYTRWFLDAVAFRPHPIHDLRRVRLGSPRDPIRIGSQWASFLLGRLRRRSVLVHDPFAVFSIDWFVRRLGWNVVVVVRHPLSVVSSLKRLEWTFDFSDLLQQPALMSERLEPYRAEIEDAADADVIDQGSLLWRIVYESVERDHGSDPSVHVVRHEDLSLDPKRGFARLYELLRLSYDESVKEAIERSTSSANPNEQPLRDPNSVRLDSRANLGNWRHRLDDEEVARIVESTRSVAERFYPGEEMRGATPTGMLDSG